jgi:hypothetical protein
MDLGTYFQVIIYLLMTATFITLGLIFLYVVYYGKEEKED